MVKFARYTVTSGLPGLYMPDVVYTASSKAQAKAIAAEIIENIRDDYHEDETLSVWKDADGGASISGEGLRYDDCSNREVSRNYCRRRTHHVLCQLLGWSCFISPTCP